MVDLGEGYRYTPVEWNVECGFETQYRLKCRTCRQVESVQGDVCRMPQVPILPRASNVELVVSKHGPCNPLSTNQNSQSLGLLCGEDRPCLACWEPPHHSPICSSSGFAVELCLLRPCINRLNNLPSRHRQLMALVFCHSKESLPQSPHLSPDQETLT
jgi:hypothetical protein